MIMEDRETVVPQAGVSPHSASAAAATVAAAARVPFSSTVSVLLQTGYELATSGRTMEIEINTDNFATDTYNAPYNFTDVNISSGFDTTEHATDTLAETSLPLWLAIIMFTCCGAMTFATLYGNALVCLAVMLTKQLRTKYNALIVSLAVSDFLVGLMVMPLAMDLSYKGQWTWGDTLCDFWTTADVLLCTASILNLCAISLDRHHQITKPFQYEQTITWGKTLAKVLLVWSVAAAVSFVPIIMKLFSTERREKGQCYVSTWFVYQLYATVVSFYIPLAAMIIIYYKIFKVTQKLNKEEAHAQPSKHDGLWSGVTTPLRRESNDPSIAMTTLNGGRNSKDPTTQPLNQQQQQQQLARKHKTSSLCARCPLWSCIWCCRERLSGQRKPESKATKTLSVIMGAFIACWLPFFILALVGSFLSIPIPVVLEKTLLWVGYFNSCLNPIIYARYNRAFRQPFKDIICFRCRTMRQSMRREAYLREYGDIPHVPSRHTLQPTQTTVHYESQGHTITGVTTQNGNATNNNGAKL